MFKLHLFDSEIENMWKIFIISKILFRSPPGFEVTTYHWRWNYEILNDIDAQAQGIKSSGVEFNLQYCCFRMNFVSLIRFETSQHNRA